MGNCCDPKALQSTSIEPEGGRTELVGRSKDSRTPSLTAASVAELRDKYLRWLNDKELVIKKNEEQAEMKEERLKQLQQTGKRLECDKIKRQIDTHLKLVRQAQEEKGKIQEKLDNL